MMKAASKAGKQGKVKNSLHDKTFTPRAAAAACMQILDIEKTDHCLDPARGGGAFYDQFPCDEDHKHYCEIVISVFNIEPRFAKLVSNDPQAWANAIFVAQRVGRNTARCICSVFVLRKQK